MRNLLAAAVMATILIPSVTFAQEVQQKPQQQISFARESRPHAYYVEQARLWWEELQKDSTSENNWYNYFRACRNAQGTANWQTDFVKESPYLRPGPEIVRMIREKIPDTFTYYYLSYLDGGVGTDNGENILKAYRMNPHFPGIHSSVISYAESSGDTALRRSVNRDWITTNYTSDALLTYGYNALMSLEPNAILLTQQDNDTYPVWMLQDALGIREDVTVVNIDFLLMEPYRSRLFQVLKVDSMNLDVRSVDDYQMNWEKVVKHILTAYRGDRPLYIGMTLYQSLYKDFEKNLAVSGLAYRFTRQKADLTPFNTKLYEKIFLLDYLSHRFVADPNQANVDYQNVNYLAIFKIVYDSYTKKGRKEDAARIRELAYSIARKVGDDNLVKAVEEEFR